MQLQVAMFLHVMFRSIEQRFLSLVIAPDFLIGKWFQYLTEIAGLKTITVNSESKLSILFIFLYYIKCYLETNENSVSFTIFLYIFFYVKNT